VHKGRRPKRKQIATMMKRKLTSKWITSTK